ncbi:unnamed protein product [Arabis nemorensis]|uniref:NYN domain-containing protein n=1 Tax=Arabis nemorensis TaxID=586526 RepID=A0A565C1K9_9BRAS|nr:unnamed protein product [Arabis nemorensis]
MACEKPKACVFWDGVDFPFRQDPDLISQNMKHSLEKLVLFGDFSFKAFVDEDMVTDELLRVYKEAGITIIPVPGDKYARAHYMITHILLWTVENPYNYPYRSSLCVMSSKLIENKSLFRHILLKVERLDYNVIVALEPPPGHLPSTELRFVTLASFSKSLLDGVEPCNDQSRTSQDPQDLVRFPPLCASAYGQDDLEDLPLPEGGDTDLMSHRTKSFLGPQRFPEGHLPIKAYIHNENFSPESFHVYKDAGMTILIDISTRLPIVNGNVLLHHLFIESVVPGCIPPYPVHMPKETFPNRVPSLFPKDISTRDIIILWNVEGCPTAKDRTLGLTIHEAIRPKGYRGYMSIMPYVDSENERANVPWSDDNMIKITVVTKGENEYAKVTRMMLDMLFWAMNNDEPTHFILISKPSKYMTNWDNVVRVLQARGSDVILAPSDDIELPLSTVNLKLLCKHPVAEKLPLSVELSGGVEFGAADHVGVFWVVENENFPPDPMKLMDVPKKPGMRIAFIPERNKYEKATRILADMLVFARKNAHQGSSLIVISEPFQDAMFDFVAQSLRGIGYNVVSTDLDYMVTFGTAEWSSRSRVFGSGYCQCERCLIAIRMAPAVKCQHGSLVTPCYRV